MVVGGGGRWFLPGTPLLVAWPPVLQASHGGERGVNFHGANWDEGLSPGVWVASQCEPCGVPGGNGSSLQRVPHCSVTKA